MATHPQILQIFAEAQTPSHLRHSTSFSEEELANVRAIATLLLENSLTSAKLKTTDDIANFTKEKLDAGREGRGVQHR